MDAYSGTKPVASSHAFDAATLASYLRERLPGFAGPLTIEQFKGGQSNPTYKLVTPGRSYVLRSNPARPPSCCLRRTRSSANTVSCTPCTRPTCRCRKCCCCAKTKQ
jgi:aminoglycoside phosphotransferase (APT) family kinase protein